MKAKNITYRSRNDFKAIFQCEHCNNEFEAWGYDDSNYWLNVIPNAICPKCGINSNGEDAEQSEKRLGRTYKI